MSRKLAGGHFCVLKKAWLQFVREEKEKRRSSLLTKGEAMPLPQKSNVPSTLRTNVKEWISMCPQCQGKEALMAN
jgi:hypothetical protein